MPVKREDERGTNRGRRRDGAVTNGCEEGVQLRSQAGRRGATVPRGKGATGMIE